MAATREKPGLIEFRCPNDGRLLFKVSELVGVEVEVKCPRCNQVIEAALTGEH